MPFAVFDTYCGSRNSGDAIIMDAVNKQLNQLFPLTHKEGYPTHYPLSYKAVRQIAKTELCFVGGTNLLSSKRYFRSKKNQWAINHLGAAILRHHCVLLGAGWQNYQDAPDWKARWFYQTVLSDKLSHSVRDSYTEGQLRQAGMTNIINTACPTMWDLTPDHCDTIPKDKGTDVIFTLTDYRRAPQQDTQLIEHLLNHYRQVYFWIQGAHDLDYLRALLSPEQLARLQLVGPSLNQYDQVLEQSDSLDYIGTRLHAGIRALQKQRRCIIIAVDNRATEKQGDFNLTVIQREQPEQLEDKIHQAFATEIIIPQQAIARWKAQFSE